MCVGCINLDVKLQAITIKYEELKQRFKEKLEEISILKKVFAEKQMRSCAVCSIRLPESELMNHLCREGDEAINCEYCSN